MIFIGSPAVALPTSVGLEGFDTSPEVDAKIASGSYTLTNKIKVKWVLEYSWS